MWKEGTIGIPKKDGKYKSVKYWVKYFEEPSEDWALFVMANRSRNNLQPTHSFDIVIGPVADDTIATLFRNFDDGIIDLQMLVNGLKYKKVSSQYLFHSAKAIKYLHRL